MKEILTLIIFISNIFQVENDSVLVNMVSFSGYAEGEYFKGNILPGAVDTQTVLPPVLRTTSNTKNSVRIPNLFFAGEVPGDRRFSLSLLSL